MKIYEVLTKPVPKSEWHRESEGVYSFNVGSLEVKIFFGDREPSTISFTTSKDFFGEPSSPTDMKTTLIVFSTIMEIIKDFSKQNNINWFTINSSGKRTHLYKKMLDYYGIPFEEKGNYIEFNLRSDM